MSPIQRLATLGEGIRIAFDALRANKLRAGLTIVGVTIGVLVVVTMAAVITGVRSSVLEGFEAAGPQNFFVMPFDFSDVRIVNQRRPPWWDRPEITEDEVRRVADLPGVHDVVVDFDFQSTMEFESTRLEGIQSSGDSEGWPGMSPGDFVAGRSFTDQEVRQAREVVVISRDLAEELFGLRDPIGKRVRMGTRNTIVARTFTVIGVYDMQENIFAEAVRHFAVVPYTAARKKLKALDRFTFLGFVVIPEEGYEQVEVMDQVIGTMRGARGLRPGDENDFAVIRSDQLVELFNRFTGVFFLVMLALSSVGLMVGGVGVIGIMMIAVTERTREIGIRKAVGATRREILWQFLVEAAFLTLLGGGLGMLVGGGAAELVERLTPIPAEIPIWSVAAALGMAVLTGMLFGLVPAFRASRMEPVDALRYE